jgi:hypothetical protein
MTGDLSVTNVQWLPPTRANIDKAAVIIPPGYKQVSSPANADFRSGKSAPPC